VIALAVPAVLLMLQVPGVEQPRAGDGQWKT
jgi:hypothetical protein